MSDAGSVYFRPIVIAGFMGSGKTTVAAALAELLHCDAVDLDQLITEAEKRSPREIIEEDGEPAFREVETRHLRVVLGQGVARVIALGGGAWTLPGNRELIAEFGGLTVWLDTPFELCWQRIVAAGNERPLAPDATQARERFESRREIYALAKVWIQTNSQMTVNEIAGRIAASIEEIG
jgi:shikimate kinase